MVWLNGREYTNTEFDGYGHAQEKVLGSGKRRFPTQVFEDFLADLSAAVNASSATSQSIGTGSKAFTLGTHRPFAVGSYVSIGSTGTPANTMWGQVTAYDSGTMVLTVNVTVTTGSGGPHTDWDIQVSGARGSNPLSTPVAVAEGGTGGTTAALARTALGLDGLSNLDVWANSDFNRWTRGSTALNTAGGGINAWGGITLTYGCDGWAFQRGSSSVGTVARQAHTIGQTDVPNNPVFFSRMDITTAGTGNFWLSKIVEDCTRYAGQTVTFGIWIRVNLAGRSVTPRVRQDFGSGGSPSADVSTNGSAVNLTQNVWTLVTATIAVPSVSGKTKGSTLTTDYIAFEWDLGAAAIGQWDFSHFAFTPGSALGPFVKLPIALDQQLGMRYLQCPMQTRFAGHGTTTNNSVYHLYLPQQMRAAPTLTLGAATDVNIATGGLAAMTGGTIVEGGYNLQFHFEPSSTGYASRSYASVYASAEIAP